MKTLLNKDFDEDGLVASSGICDENLINVILKMDFFHRAPPKSTGSNFILYLLTCEL